MNAFVVTRGAKRFGHRCIDLAAGKVRIVLVVADSGSGKTATMRWAVQKLSWPRPIGYYVGILSREESAQNFYFLSDIQEFGERIGLITPEARTQAADILFRIDNASDNHPIPGPGVCYRLDFLAARLGLPRPDALALAPLRGLPPEITTRCPILVTGSIIDTPRSLAMKLAEALDLDGAPEVRTWQRNSYLAGWLRKLPTILFLDEADTLSLECLRWFQQLTEETQTPFCLAGTQQLVGRLQRDPRLRPIATRVEVRVDLGRVTAADLQAAFPHLGSDVILTVWQASGRNFRIALHIVKAIEELRRERPGRRISQRAVAAVAQQVLAARAIQLGADEIDAAEEPMTLPAREAAVAHQATTTRQPRRAAVG